MNIVHTPYCHSGNDIQICTRYWCRSDNVRIQMYVYTKFNMQVSMHSIYTTYYILPGIATYSVLENRHINSICQGIYYILQSIYIYTTYFLWGKKSMLYILHTFFCRVYILHTSLRICCYSSQDSPIPWLRKPYPFEMVSFLQIWEGSPIWWWRLTVWR